jgi:hypothetical protein
VHLFEGVGSTGTSPKLKHRLSPGGLGHSAQSVVSSGIRERRRRDELEGSPLEPNASSWVIEMWWRSPRSSNTEKPIYWHGPSAPYRASSLGAAIAEFPSESEAASSFEDLVVRLPRGVSRWAAVTVQTASSRAQNGQATVSWGGSQGPASE